MVKYSGFGKDRPELLQAIASAVHTATRSAPGP